MAVQPLTRRRWKLLAGLVAAGALYLVLAIAAPAVARQMAFFRVRRVEVVGARYLAPETVARSLRLRAGASVADPTEGLAKRALSVPGVLTAEVSRRLPGTLVVTVTEREPVALVPQRDGMAMVDARARVLPYDPRRVAPDLPVLRDADAAVAGVLGRVRELDPTLYAQTSAAWREDQEGVVLETDNGRVRLGAAATGEDMRAVMQVAQWLKAKGRPWAELDGRFAGQVVLRSKGRA